MGCNKSSTNRATHNFHQSGFTIVELLIVVVVIAILAAITVVAFSGIQERARQSSALATAQQASTKISAYTIENADSYPSNLNDVGITNTATASYQYRFDNSSIPKTFCLTATSQNISYFVSSSNSSPQAGACSGHGANGAQPITNLAFNPSFEAAFSANTLNTSNTWGSGGAYSGTRFLRSTRTNTSGGSGPWMNIANVQGNTVYRLKLALRSNVTTTREVVVEWINTSTNTIVSRSTIASVTPTPSWETYTGTATAPSTANIFRLTVYTPGSSTGTTNDYVDIDGIMVTESSTEYSYADGNSPGWLWNGSVNSSTSTGSPL